MLSVNRGADSTRPQSYVYTMYVCVHVMHNRIPSMCVYATGLTLPHKTLDPDPYSTEGNKSFGNQSAPNDVSYAGALLNVPRQQCGVSRMRSAYGACTL